ncbi:MAG: hypothetical protein HJJLKODD_00666 [Phycisphaerae bacterium]|nr:hypothetical protein [Phycisphaerae bacterium]
MALEKDTTLMHEWKNQTTTERDSFAELGAYFESGLGTTISKLENFPKHVRRQALSKFLARADLFRMILNVHGSVIDGGVNAGCSLMTFAQLSAIFEPVNYTRRIIGFDTFTGIPDIHAKDQSAHTSAHVCSGGFAAEGYDQDIRRAAAIFDHNRNLGHVPKIELVKGDVRETMPRYVKDNPHLIVSLLHLDMDVFEATQVALQTFLPRMPRGALIMFDEINQPGYPGETMAVLETVGIRALRIQRCIYETGLSYAILE